MRISRRAQLLSAASRLVARDGAGALTLDAVARESGVSKGGVLYHFPSKDALITAMVEAIVLDFEAALQATVRQSRGQNWLRSYVKASMDEAQASAEVRSGMVAAISENPRLLQPLRDKYKEWQSSGFDGVSATIVRLAIDGLWFADLFDLAPPRGKMRAQVLNQLLKMTKGGSAP